MQKVVFSVRKAGRQTKETGVGYISETDLCIPKLSKNGKPYIKVFEDCIKRPITEGEYSTSFYEIQTIEQEVFTSSGTSTGFETREIYVTYYIWFKIIKDSKETDKTDDTEE